MNLRRRFFLIWMVVSAAFVVVAAMYLFPPIREEFAVAEAFDRNPIVPTPCDSARGNPGADYSTERVIPGQDTTGPWNFYGRNDGSTCWYPLAKFRTLYPEYNNLKDQAVIKMMFERAKDSPPSPAAV